MVPEAGRLERVPEPRRGPEGWTEKFKQEAEMATKDRSKSENQGSSSSRSRSGGGSSAFEWGNSQTGIIVGAAVAGAAVGLAANAGRKLLVQMTSGATGDWADALTTEHRLTLATFDKIEATKDSQTSARSALLAKL